MGRTYIGYGYTNAEGVATLDYDANGNQLPKKSYACHSRNTSVVAEASIDNVITASNSIRFCENYVPPSETLSLTADKSVLSYADSDSCTLTATYDGSDVSGKSVVFKVGSTVLATETTDSNGVATYEYESQGVGDVTITAECMNLQETYELIDAKYYASNSYINSQLTDYDNHSVAFLNYETQYDDTVYFKFNSKPTHCLIGIGGPTQSGLVWELNNGITKYHRNYLSGGSYSGNWLDDYSEIGIKPTFNGTRANGNIYFGKVYYEYWQFELTNTVNKLRVDKFPNDDYDIEIIVL